MEATNETAEPGKEQKEKAQDLDWPTTKTGMAIFPRHKRSPQWQDQIIKMPSGCWIWTGKTEDGRPVLNFQYKPNPRKKKTLSAKVPVARLAVQEAGKAVTKSQKVTTMFTCQNKLCCNPDHLKIVDQSTISKHLHAKNRHEQKTNIHRRPNLKR